MRHLAWRVAGVALTGVALLGYDAQSPSPVHLLLLPMTMALGAWLIIRNATVVLTALTALAAIHSEPSSPSSRAASRSGRSFNGPLSFSS